ncbi:MAG TPA: TonB-dependent receptor [Opitutaceae bacterium]|nr:TonB-dependent receptor [Opitutaceae bacterium]
MTYLPLLSCTSLPARRFALIVVPAALVGALTAQPSVSVGTTPVPPEVVVTLDPFQVNTDSDRGFIATSSLAGGRLAGELKDTPVAYTVLTRDFIDALELNDLQTMSQWSTNATDLADDNTTYNTGNAVRISSRGVSSNSPQRNFFPVNFNFDSYNIERLDLARGPNAILFGTSGVGGTTNSVTKRARTERRFSEVRVSAGSWDNYRATLDHNQPLGGKVALRVNALYLDRAGWRDGDFETRTGVTVAGTWSPFANTEIRAEFESGEMDRTIVTTSIDDNASGWNGSSVFSARIAGAQNAAGIARTAARTAVFTPSSGLQLVNYEGWATTQGGNAAVAVPAGGTLVVGPTANINNQSIVGQLNLPSDLYALAEGGSKFVKPSRTTSTFPHGDLFGVRNKEYTLSLTQRFGENLFIELAANTGTEDTNSDIGISRTMTKINIDVNSVLPNGQPNPNFLEPYVQSTSFPYLQLRDKTNLRGALGYVLNDTRLGSFAFNVIAGQSDNKFDRNAWRYMIKANPDPRQWPNFANIFYRFYLNTDANRSMPRPESWTYVDPVNNTTATVPAGLVRDYQNTSFNQVNETDYQYLQAAANGKFFKNRLHLLTAARRDKYKTHQESIVLQFDNPTNWNGYERFFKPTAPADWATLTYRERDAAGNPVGSPLPADTRPRISNQRDARYANDRFRDDYAPPDTQASVDTFTMGSVFHLTRHVSVFANYAESFQPPSIQLKLDGTIFQPSTAKGRDYGVRFTALDGDLVVNVIRYEGEGKGRSVSSSPFSTNFLAIINANKLGDLVSNLNSRGLLPLPLGYVDSASVETEGWELELTANLTKNWRLMFNGALPRATESDANQESLAFWNEKKETLRLIVQDAGGSFVGDVATFTGVPPPGQSVTEGQNAVNAWNDNVVQFASLVNNQKLDRLTEATANLYTDYQFARGPLKGLRVGGGINYRGKQVIGNRGGDTIRDPSNPNGAIDDPKVGPFDYVYTDPYTVGTVTLNYNFRLKRKYNIVLNLKVDNLFDYDQPLYYNSVLRPMNGDLTNPARVATPARYSWVTPRSYVFTTTFKF